MKLFDKVRKNENKRLMIQDINTLTGTKYLWLKNRSNFTKKNKRDSRMLSQNQLESILRNGLFLLLTLDSNQ